MAQLLKNSHISGLHPEQNWNCQTGFEAKALENASNVQIRDDSPKPVQADSLNVICQREGGRIKDIKADGTAKIEYNDIRKWNDSKDYMVTSYVKDKELVRNTEKHQVQTSVRKSVPGKTIYTVDHEIKPVTLKRWVQKTRKVMRPHNCIVQKTVQKEHKVETKEVKVERVEKMEDAYEWEKCECTENLYPEPQFHVEECWVRPRQEILTFPDACTNDYTLREVIVYDVNKEMLRERETVNNKLAHSQTGSRFVKDLPPKMKTRNFTSYNRKHVQKPSFKNQLSLVPANRTLAWEETEYFIKQTEEEVEETYWVEEEYTVSQLVPVIKTKQVDIEYDEPAIEEKEITTEVEQDAWKQVKTKKTADFTLYENVLREVDVNLHTDCNVISRDIHKEKISSDLAQKLDNLRVSSNIAMTMSGLTGKNDYRTKQLNAVELNGLNVAELSDADHLTIFGLEKGASSADIEAVKSSHLSALGLHVVDGKIVTSGQVTVGASQNLGAAAQKVISSSSANVAAEKTEDVEIKLMAVAVGEDGKQVVLESESMGTVEVNSSDLKKSSSTTTTTTTKTSSSTTVTKSSASSNVKA